MSVLRRHLAGTLLAALLLAACTGEQPEASVAETSPPLLPRGTAILTDSEGTTSTILVEIASTSDQRALGLMGRDFLPARSGMAFLFEEPSDGGFWMKDTLIPLDIAFWDADGTIVDIQQMVPCEADPCERYPAAAPFVGALEVNPGTFEDANIDVGNTLEIVPDNIVPSAEASFDA